MAYVIAEGCIDVKDQACVEVCPVDCIHGEDADRMLYIAPSECIDCGACEPVCPMQAIVDEVRLATDQQAWRAINALWYEDRSAARAMVDKTLAEKP